MLVWINFLFNKQKKDNRWLKISPETSWQAVVFPKCPVSHYTLIKTDTTHWKCNTFGSFDCNTKIRAVSECPHHYSPLRHYPICSSVTLLSHLFTVIPFFQRWITFTRTERMRYHIKFLNYCQHSETLSIWKQAIIFLTVTDAIWLKYVKNFGLSHHDCPNLLPK